MEENKSKPKKILLPTEHELPTLAGILFISAVAAGVGIIFMGMASQANVHSVPKTEKETTSYILPSQPPPQDAKGFFQRGLDFTYRGDFDSAIGDFKKATELDPKYTDAWCEMGVAYMEKSQWDTAIAQLSKCIEIDPGHPKAQYAIAVSFARKPSPDVKAAREHFEMSKKLGFIYPQWFEDFLKRLEAGER